MVGRFAVVHHIIAQDRAAEEHGFHERRVGSAGTVAVDIVSGIAAQAVERVEIVYRVNDADVWHGGIFLLQFLAVVAVFPVADENQSLVRFCKRFQRLVAVVFRLDAANCDGIVSAFHVVFLQHLQLFGLINVADGMVAAVSNQCGIFSIGFLHIVLNAFVVGHNHIGITHGDGLRCAQYPACQFAPFFATVFQSVDVDDKAFAVEQTENRQEAASRCAEHHNHVISTDGAYHRHNVVRDTLHSVGVDVYIFQFRALVGRQILCFGHILTAAIHRIFNIRRAVFPNDIFHQRFKTAVTCRHSLRADNSNFLHNTLIQINSVIASLIAPSSYRRE